MLGYHIRIVLHPNTPLSANNTFVPTSLFQHLPAQTPQQTARRNALFNPKPKDYRYGPIRLDWLDFDKTSTSMVNVREKGPGRGELAEIHRMPPDYRVARRDCNCDVRSTYANKVWFYQFA